MTPIIGRAGYIPTQLTKRGSENVVVTKNYCYGNVTENVIITLVCMFLRSKYVIPNIVRTFTQQFGNVINFIKTFR